MSQNTKHSTFVEITASNIFKLVSGSSLYPSKNNNVSYYQWRTIKKLDYAFNSFDYDPQLIDFKESIVVRLPREYRGKRLGHLWSISWVADNINLD